MKTIFLAIPTIRQGGGAARVILTLLNNLDRSRFRITLVVNVLEAENMPLFPSDIGVIELGFVKSRFAIVRFCWIIQKQKPDLVFSTMGHLNILIAAFRWALPSKTKFVARETNTVSVKNRYQPYPRLFDLMYRLFYSSFDQIVAQCEFMKSDLVKNYQIPKNIIEVINNPLDTKLIDQYLNYKVPASKGTKPDQSVLRLIAVGRLSHQKGYDLLFRALVLLDTPFQLDIYGIGSDRLRLSQLAEKMGLANNVSFKGFISNPYAKIAASHALVLGSRYEGFPNVILEANYCGVGVVAFDGPGGTSEIIEHGRNGFLIKPGDYYGFAQAIKKIPYLSLNPDDLREMARNKFGLDVILSQYERLFDKCVSDAPM